MLRWKRLAFLGVVAPLVVFAVIGNDVRRRRRLGWDAAIARTLDRHVPWTPQSGDAVADATTYAGTAAAAAVAVVLFRERQARSGAFWALAIGGPLALDPLLKHVFKRPSVSGGPGYSFPSGTAMLAMSAAASAVVLVPGRRLPLALTGTLLVAAHGGLIVHARWHYPSDIVGGWAVAAAWVSAAWLVVVGPSARSRRFRAVGGPLGACRGFAR